MKRLIIGSMAALAAALCLAQPPNVAPPPLIIGLLAEKKVAQLPAGPLVWRLETFATDTQAEAAAGPTSLVVKAAGTVWLATLGPAGGASAGASRVAEIGPLPQVVATEYLLRINEASGIPGSITAVHTHPGSEAFYVLAGETSSRTAHGVMRVRAGESATGQGAGVPMQVSSSGSTDLHSLVLFVVDATKPFSTPAKLP